VERKLKCAIVDDEPEAHLTIRELLENSPIAEITHSFYNPSDFLKHIHSIAFDVVFLDIIFYNDKLQGFDIAPMLKAENKIIVFISGSNKHIIEACKDAGAIDVIPKPNTKEKLISALIKASHALPSLHEANHKEHELFFVAERKEKVSLLLSDFLYVKTPDRDARNKELILKNGEKLTLMDCKFSYLLNRSPKLGQINISELVSYDIVDGVFHDAIYIKSNVPRGIPSTLTLSKSYRKDFNSKFV
jgi:DNA-binding LytR/AlgR family response regulator